MEKYLEKLYYDENEPTFYGGINLLYQKAKKKFPDIKQEDVKSFLERQETYTLHKPVKKYKSLRTVSAGLDVDHQIDLCDMQKIKKYNKGYGYILTCVDVLSKYGWAIPVKTKSPKDVVVAYQKIIDEGRAPWRVFSDKGREWFGDFKKLLDQHGIQQIFTENPIVKASLAERYNRTLKTRLYKYFTKNQTWSWLKILPKIVKALNYTVNRITQMRPVDVTHKNDQIVYKRIYGDLEKKKEINRLTKSKFKVGDLVRITQNRGVFSKGYTPTFSKEIFVVAERLNRDQIVYKLKDLSGESLTSIFYEAELVRVRK